MPIRWRLTIWYTVILLVLLLLFGSTVYILLDYSLTTEIDNNISSKADDVIKSTKVVGTLPFFLRQVVLPDVEVFAAPDVYLQVVAANGEITVKSNNLWKYNLPVEKKVFGEAAKGQISYATYTVENQKLRMVVKPLYLDDSIVGFLQVARPLKSVDTALARLRNFLLLGGFASLLVSLWLGWFLSAKALGPIRNLTLEAKAIGEKGDLQRRVSYVGPSDELGELAVTFNQMLANLEDLYTRLSDSLIAQQRFVADASHELRTPLTSIQGNIDFLLQLEDRNTEISNEALADISAETRRLSRLVRELLTLARADSGQQLELEAVELLPVLEEITRQARFLTKGQEFITELEPARELFIEADADYFKQMLLIFLDNALKYTPAGKKVIFSVRVNSENVELIFQDEGPGIPSEDLPNLFERFYRAQPSRSGEGTGLGLAIANWIANQHRANIKVESELGRGSIFIISLQVLSIL